MSLKDKLEATPPVPEPKFRRQKHPTGMEFEWDGNSGTISFSAAEQPRSWDEFIRDAGLDPEEVEVLEPVQVRGWDSNVGGGEIKRMHYYRLSVRRMRSKIDLQELIVAAKDRAKKKKAPQKASEASQSFVVALGDLQLGKADGDGVEGTVDRFMASTDKAVARYKQLSKIGLVNSIRLFHLGDCIEGFTAMGGAQTWRTVLTTTEQFRLYRRLLMEQVKAFAAITDDLVMAGIPGNHDEALRPIQTYGDSWAIEAVSTVRDALLEAKGYDHVKMLASARDELTLTLDVSGTIVGLAHGHQWRSNGAEKWWAGQSHGRQPIGDADILFSGHLHHLRIVEDTGGKTWIQVPALESESTFWRHRTGQVTRPGIVTAVVGGGGWSSLEVL
jgi:predicted phosphodiesterase